jgi:hypothetical protein
VPRTDVGRNQPFGKAQSVVVLIEATQQVGSSAPDWLASGEICRAAEPRAHAAFVALRGRAAPGTKKEIGGGDFVAGALGRCPFDGQRTPARDSRGLFGAAPRRGRPAVGLATDRCVAMPAARRVPPSPPRRAAFCSSEGICGCRDPASSPLSSAISPRRKVARATASASSPRWMSWAARSASAAAPVR